MATLKDELDQLGPALLQSHIPKRAGELSVRLCRLAGGNLEKVFLCSSGSEGAEAAIKFSRTYTERNGLLYAERAFHGLTCGALSLMGDDFWRRGFGPMLPGAKQIPFNDLAALEQKLKTKKFAAFFVEPIQGEGGSGFRCQDIWPRLVNSARNIERCWYSVKCRRGSTEQLHFWRRSTTTQPLISLFWRKQ
ncbi:MAG: aminotransferase class III-fold pyridoxal phosphate-dependent enzyme [Acidobacteriaceae bacterium]|nr:aminotransferase class III-fold pyridoxal phosphate-dependent enzyme [Acidobacteriaceae bacterium]